MLNVFSFNFTVGFSLDFKYLRRKNCCSMWGDKCLMKCLNEKAKYLIRRWMRKWVYHDLKLIHSF
ncbi:hypothetical protein Sjap_025700 [Stephania japonica]|uniref:Uncharacterized protein n=1 Tax=Stephania japonica TaxID=461633 RepID=A0AAP0HFV6_9MAGN